MGAGAFYILLQATHAADGGLDFQEGRKVFAQAGGGGRIPVFLHRLPRPIGAPRFEAAVGFSENLGIPFDRLRRQDVFGQFRI